MISTIVSWPPLSSAVVLITARLAEVARDGQRGPSEWLAQEYYEDDVNKLAEVAPSERGVSTLHEATGGVRQAARAGPST